MAENSKIEWTDHTFNAWTGCTKVSPACDHCYAESWAKRSGLVEWGSHPRRRTSADYWKQPIKWNRAAERDGIRRKVFCCSLADVFDNQVDPRWRDDLWGLIDSTRSLDWLLLTKRPQNITKMLPAEHCLFGEPWPHVWLGTTVENQEEADRRIPRLLAAPAQVHFLSCEPLLERLDLSAIPLRPGQFPLYAPLTGNWWHTDTGLKTTIDWVIAGGESGPNARPTNPAWLRSLRYQCATAGVPFFFKQWGEWVEPWQLGAEHWQHVGAVDDPAHGRGKLYETADSMLPMFGGKVFETSLPFGPYPQPMMVRAGKRIAGAMIDGREWREFPSP